VIKQEKSGSVNDEDGLNIMLRSLMK
jgi:hypothetical protein